MSRVLFIQFDENDCRPNEIETFEKLVRLGGLTFNHEKIENRQSFRNVLKKHSNIKYLILAGHGNESGIGSVDDSFTISWDQVAADICDSGCFNLVVEAKLLLWCCSEGIERIACTLMDACSQLEFIAGPTREETSIDIFGLFSVFMFNLEISSKKVDAESSIHRAQEGTGVEINHFSRFDKDNDGEYYCKKCKDYNDKQEEQYKLIHIREGEKE